MHRSTHLLCVVPLALLCCAHAPPLPFDPPITPEQLRLEREQEILSKSRDALFGFSLPILLEYQSFYEQHGIVLHWVADSTFHCAPRSDRSCATTDPLDFYICPISNERLGNDPLLAATYDPQMNILWLTNAEVSPVVRMLMIAGELSMAWQLQMLGVEPSPAEESKTLQQFYFLMYGLLDELTGCSWSRLVFESAQDQQRMIAEEALNWEVSLPFGSPRDGRLITQAFHEEYFVDSLDRRFLLSMMRIHSTFARFGLQESEQRSIISEPVVLQFPTD